MSPKLIDSITVPPPGLAIAEEGGVQSYRTEILAVTVEERKDNGRALRMQIGESVATLELTVEARARLVNLLT